METELDELRADNKSVLSVHESQLNGLCKLSQSEDGECLSDFQYANTIGTSESNPTLTSDVACSSNSNGVTVNGTIGIDSTSNGHKDSVDYPSSVGLSTASRFDADNNDTEDSELTSIPKGQFENCNSLCTEEKNGVQFRPDDSISCPALSTDKTNSDDDSISNLSSIGQLEDQDKVSLLLARVEDLTTKLVQSQERIEALLEEKQKWLATRQQHSTPYVKPKSNISSDTAAIVVKFAQSEQLRMKAEAKVNELEAQIHRLQTGIISNSDSAVPSEKSEPMEELHKALMEAREQAEQLRHTLRLEETHVSDLGAKLNAAREVHRNEQKRVARQAEVISKLNHHNDSLKQQLYEANKVREREAKRLCSEVETREITTKYNKALSEMAALQKHVIQLEEEHKSKLELERKYEELQKTHDSLLLVREEMTSCMERETHLSEFTQRLTERNADLQTAYLAMQERLEVSERTLSETSRASLEATDLLRALEQHALAERTDSAKVINHLEAKVAELQQSEEALKEELSLEQVKNAALKRKQHALDRELARLTAQQRKSSQQLPVTEGLRPDTNSKMTPNNSAIRLSALSDSTSTISGLSKSSSPPVVLGNVLLTGSGNGDVCVNREVSALGEATEYRIGGSTPGVQILEFDQVLLLNKIDRLHRTNARLMDKVDFMHEHINQLTQELQKKSQILQHYLARKAEDESAAMPSVMDENKRQRIHRGGNLMAAMFESENDTSPPDLRTSLQLNQKLQLLLEDTLYKNLILKENVDTFADEVGRLKRANKELKIFFSNHSDRPTADD